MGKNNDKRIEKIPSSMKINGISLWITVKTRDSHWHLYPQDITHPVCMSQKKEQEWFYIIILPLLADFCTLEAEITEICSGTDPAVQPFIFSCRLSFVTLISCKQTPGRNYSCYTYLNKLSNDL